MIGGDFSAFNGVARKNIARLNSDGSLDAAFNPVGGAGGFVSALFVQTDGKVVYTGYDPGSPGSYVMRYKQDGLRDWSFNVGSGQAGAAVFAVQPDGKLFLGGNFTYYSNAFSKNIVRIHTGDADQDGIEDAADYFPNNAASATDTDKDGKPDAWLQPNTFSCAVNAAACNGLVLDLDDDNDGMPDYIDAAPLDAAVARESILPVNSVYRGGLVTEKAWRQ
jgi:hypothetical protein